MITTESELWDYVEKSGIEITEEILTNFLINSSYAVEIYKDRQTKNPLERPSLISNRQWYELSMALDLTGMKEDVEKHAGDSWATFIIAVICPKLYAFMGCMDEGNKTLAEAIENISFTPIMTQDDLKNTLRGNALKIHNVGSAVDIFNDLPLTLGLITVTNI